MNHVVVKKPLRWQELIEQARNGDDVALGQIVSRVLNDLMVVANGSLNQKPQSKLSTSGIVQQSMLEAHQSIDRFNGSSEAEIRAWLRKIVVDSTRYYNDAAGKLWSRGVQRLKEVLGEQL